MDTPVDAPVVQALLAGHRAVTGEPAVIGGVPGTTDGTILTRDAGLPTVVYGPGGKWIAHQADEFVEVADILTCTRAYIAAARHFLAARADERRRRVAGPANSLTDVAGLRVGHHTAIGDGYLTGTTVVLAPDGGMVAGVDVRGGGPATRETDLLDPTASVERIHALVLTGGSAYGLAACTGVMTALADRGIGLPVGPDAGEVVPLVPGAALFDLGRGGRLPGPARPPIRRRSRWPRRPHRRRPQQAPARPRATSAPAPAR